jgi:APA family basic amino acid/polyamine antiporter
MAVPRVTYALGIAEPAGPLRLFARLHPQFGTPANAVLLQTGMALVILMFGAFDRILAFIIFSSVVFLALTAATLFRGPAPKAWWYPAAPLVFIAGCAILALMLIANSTIPSLIGAALVLVGLPVRWLMVRGRRPAAASPESAQALAPDLKP